MRYQSNYISSWGPNALYHFRGLSFCFNKGFYPKTLVWICHGTLVIDLQSPEEMELLETTCILLYTSVYLRRFKSTVTYSIVCLFFLVWGHPHTTQIVVICTKMCCSLTAYSQFGCCWCSKMMFFFTRLLKDDWMLRAKIPGVVKIYQFQSDWLATMFPGVRLHSFSFKVSQLFLVALVFQSLWDSTWVTLLKHNHIFSLISDLCIGNSLYLCLVKREFWPYRSSHVISVLCILCGDCCAFIATVCKGLDSK